MEVNSNERSGNSRRNENATCMLMNETIAVVFFQVLRLEDRRRIGFGKIFERNIVDSAGLGVFDRLVRTYEPVNRNDLVKPIFFLSPPEVDHSR